MVWTSPITFVAASILTAAQLNAHLRDNLLETAPAKATTAGRIFVSTGANAIAERAITAATIATSETTTSTTFTDLTTAGPTITVTTGSQAIVFVAAQMSNLSETQSSFVSYLVSGATSNPANVDRGAAHQQRGNPSNQITRVGSWSLMNLNPGSNTFTAKYSVDAGTGTFSNRFLLVIAL